MQPRAICVSERQLHRGTHPQLVCDAFAGRAARLHVWHGLAAAGKHQQRHRHRQAPSQAHYAAALLPWAGAYLPESFDEWQRQRKGVRMASSCTAWRVFTVSAMAPAVPAKPSFLQNVQLKPEELEDELTVSDDEPQQQQRSSGTPSTSSTGSPSGSSSKASAAASSSRGSAAKGVAQPSKPSHGKRKKKKQWRTKSNVDGLVVYSLGLAAAAGAGLWYAWKWWQKRSKSRAAAKQATQVRGGPHRCISHFE